PAQAFVAANGGSLLTRIRRLCGARAEATNGPSRWLAGAALLTVLAALLVTPSLPLHATAAETPQQGNPAPPAPHAAKAPKPKEAKTKIEVTVNPESDSESDSDSEWSTDSENAAFPTPAAMPAAAAAPMALVAPVVHAAITDIAPMAA